eukprot:COSAG06_NODE_2550_length_6687_cov_4.096843_3_plen_189_part_00
MPTSSPLVLSLTAQHAQLQLKPHGVLLTTVVAGLDELPALKIKTARWININQGPCWKDPTGKTIVKHPTQVWIRQTLEHTEKPVIVDVARWMTAAGRISPKYKGSANPMRAMLSAKTDEPGYTLAHPDPSDRTPQMRFTLELPKIKDLNDVGSALPEEATDRTHDEYGDKIVASNGEHRQTTGILFNV